MQLVCEDVWVLRKTEQVTDLPDLLDAPCGSVHGHELTLIFTPVT